MYYSMLILAACLGLVLLITGRLPIRGAGLARRTAPMRSFYGRLLGAAIILWVILARAFLAHNNTSALILISAALLILAVICIFLSMEEPVR